MDRAAQNVQESFLNAARKEKTPIAIYLVSGVKLSGKIKSFDKYSLILESSNQEQLIFKHAISTVVMTRTHGSAPTPPGDQRPEQTQPAPSNSEVTEGAEVSEG